MVSALVLHRAVLVRALIAGRHCVVFLGKTLNIASLHLSV